MVCFSRLAEDEAGVAVVGHTRGSSRRGLVLTENQLYSAVLTNCFKFSIYKSNTGSGMRPSACSCSGYYHQQGGRDEVTKSQIRPKARAGLVLWNILSNRPGKALELGGLGVTTPLLAGETAPM